MKSYAIRINIKDGDGQHQYDYSEDYVAQLDYEINPKQSDTKTQKEIFKLFAEKVKAAVLEWFQQDPDAVKDDLEQYAHGFDFEPDPDWSEEENKEAELEELVDCFPARCIAHIPDDIKERNSFHDAPDVHCEASFYNDLGFINDDEVDIG